MRIGLVVALVASVASFITGHESALVVSKYQPAKLAAMEGHLPASAPAGLSLFGWVDEEAQRFVGVSIPGMLSFLVHGDATKPVTGLQAFPPQDRPPVNPVFQAYHAMIGIGMGLIGLSLLGVFLWWRGSLFETRWLLWVFVPAVLGPQMANQLGWFTAEVGRQPWIVYGLMRTRRRGLSSGHQRPDSRVAGALRADLSRPLHPLCLFVGSEDSTRSAGRRPGRGVPPEVTMALDLNTTWFGLVGILLTGYAILDGFDLGVGALHLLTRRDEHRRLMINAIGPVWDGNEVWLVTGGGALFAAFPEVYATVFSGFYLAFMLLLCMLIFRAVAIEFRSKQPMGGWRTVWDVSFSVASIGCSLLLGVAFGNIIWGVPLDAQREFAGSFLGLLHPYALLVGVTTVALFMMHGAIYVVLKTDGELHQIARGWINNTIIFFIICYGMTTMATLLYLPHMSQHMQRYPVLFVVPMLTMLAIANIPREIHHGRDFLAFLSSSATIVGLMALVAIGIFPTLVLSRPNPDLSLTIYNAASSPKTLSIMLVIALIGVPIVLAYTSSIYYIFRGKVKLDAMSY